MATLNSDLTLSILNTTDDQGIPNTLYIENQGDSGDTLQFLIQNSGDDISLFSNSKGNANSEGYTFYLQFQPSTVNLEKEEVSIYIGSDDNWVADGGVWDINASLDKDTDIYTLYFLRKSNTAPVLGTSNEIKVVISDILTNTTEATASNVELNIKDSSESTYFAQTPLNIVNHSGFQYIPIKVSVDAGQYLLNDGKTQNAITLNLYNVGSDPIIFTDATVQVSFTVGEETFALTDKSNIPENFSIFGDSIKLGSDNFDNPIYEWPGDAGNTNDIILYPVTDATNKPTKLTLTTVDKEGLITALPPGIANISINYSNVKVQVSANSTENYWDGSFVVPLMRSGQVLSDTSVGIGTISPGKIAGQQLQLDVQGYSGFGGLRLNGGDVHNTIFSENTALSISTFGDTDQDINLKPTGNVYIDGKAGIGTSTISSNDILSIDTGSMRLNNNAVYLRGGTDQNHFLIYSKSFGGATKMDGPVLAGYGNGVLGTTYGGDKATLFWNSNGRVGIGTTSPSYNFHMKASKTGAFVASIENTSNNSAYENSALRIVAGASSYKGKAASFIQFNTKSAYIGRIKQTGSSSIQYYSTSDIRLKENIKETQFGLDDILKVKVCDYNFKTDEKDHVQTGFIAQQLHEVIPQVVGVGGDNPTTDPWDIAHAALTPHLVKAIQDLHAKVEKLETKLKKNK